MLKHLLLPLVLTIFFRSAVSAQTVSSGNPATVYPAIKAKKYKIVFITRDPLIARSLDSLVGNILYVTGKKGSLPVSIEVISKLKVARKKRPILRGMGLGALAGIPVGAIVGLASYKEPDPYSSTWDWGPGFSAGGGVLVGCLSGFPVGAIVGAFSTRYTSHDLGNVAPADKAAYLAHILSGK
jgi:hypothetical protein